MRRITIIFMIICMVIFTACTKSDTAMQSETVTDEITTYATTETTMANETAIETTSQIETPVAEESHAIDYDMYINKISSYMGNFNDAYMSGNIKTTTDEVYDLSTEGGIITVYRDDKLQRLSCHFYAEMGQSQINFYVLSDTELYYTILTSYYEGHLMDYLNNDVENDIVKYSFEEYYMDGDEHYLVDNINEVLISCEPAINVNLLGKYKVYEN